MSNVKVWFLIALSLVCAGGLAACAGAVSGTEVATEGGAPTVAPTAPAGEGVDCSRYPHWDCSDPALARIDAFIQANGGRGYVAATDWDGTLYSESIALTQVGVHTGTTRSGQSAWHLWGANHGCFPAFETADGEWSENVVEHDDFLEGKTNAVLGEYAKFAEIATFEAGMTPGEMHEAIQGYLEDYPTEAYAYPKMLDVIQQLKENDFQVWIITGSNPYFIASLVADLDGTLGYDLLAEGCDPAAPDLDRCRIVGNGAKLSPDGQFTVVYDDRFVRIDGVDGVLLYERQIVDGAGKAAAIRHYIEAQARAPVVFYAGNSGGDYEAVEYVLGQEIETLAVAVNPRGTLLDLVAVYGPQGRVVEVQAEAGE